MHLDEMPKQKLIFFCSQTPETTDADDDELDITQEMDAAISEAFLNVSLHCEAEIVVS